MIGINVRSFGSIAAAITFAAAISDVHAASAIELKTRGTARFSIELRAEVPVACNLSINAVNVSAPTNSVTPLGSFSEFCNNENGYLVVASFGSELVGSRVILDGRRIPLGATGEAVLVDSRTPGQASRVLAFEAGDKAAAGGSISLMINTRI